MSAFVEVLQAYWPALYLLGGVCFASHFGRLRRVDSPSLRFVLFAAGALCGAYAGASVVVAGAERSGHGTFENLPVAMLGRGSWLAALALCAGACWAAGQVRLRYGLALNGLAGYLLLNAVHVLVLSHGVLYETVGLFTGQQLVYGGAWAPTAAAPRRLAVTTGRLTTTLRTGGATMRVFDGVGPCFKLRFDAEQVRTLVPQAGGLMPD